MSADSTSGMFFDVLKMHISCFFAPVQVLENSFEQSFPLLIDSVRCGDHLKVTAH